jgi:hypothetical protein
MKTGSLSGGSLVSTWPALIARQIHSGVATPARSLIPNGVSASRMALVIARECAGRTRLAAALHTERIDCANAVSVADGRSGSHGHAIGRASNLGGGGLVNLVD